MKKKKWAGGKDEGREGMWTSRKNRSTSSKNHNAWRERERNRTQKAGVPATKSWTLNDSHKGNEGGSREKKKGERGDKKKRVGGPD